MVAEINYSFYNHHGSESCACAPPAERGDCEKRKSKRTELLSKLILKRLDGSKVEEASIDITDVKFDFDPATVSEGTYPITFSTRGRVYKVETTTAKETGDKVGLSFGPDDIHVMHKAVTEA